ncbi:hypothetical protein E1281_01115 [Actinomadura sp. KC345]|uniref:hypothetical protein n=1 Tax=Actinomadura sp. KC345 TaxID=2530371 RepID=UPI001051C47D|nr:hypothetical protein [Actinomadura sp. KC345]TDC58580.1 hypothetical protein E1281_01115 [Actinomadura sp. KC345]
MRTLPNPDETVVDMPPISDPPPPIPDGITHWHGESTGSWWAILPGRGEWRLVEAVSRDHLAVTVDWHLRRAAW